MPTRSKVVLGTVLLIVLFGALFAWFITLALTPQAQFQPVDQLGQRLLAPQSPDAGNPEGSLPNAAALGQPQTEPRSPSPLVGSRLFATPDVTPMPTTVVAGIPFLDPLTTPSHTIQPALTPFPTRLPLVPPVAPPVVSPPMPVPSPIPTMTPAPTALPPSSTVDIDLTSNLSKVTIGQQFNLTVIVNAGSGKPVDAVQVYLDFDATVLKAVDITTGTVLSEELQSQIDNSLGQVDYAAGTLGAAVKSPFHLATIRFRALAASGQSGTNVRFAFLENPRRSKSVTAGFDNTGSLGSITLIAE